MNSDQLRHHQWSLLLICCIVFSLHNKELVFPLYILSTHIVIYTHLLTRKHTYITTIILLLITLYTQTHPLTIQNNTQPYTHTHITQHLTTKSPTCTYYHKYTNTTYNYTQHTTLGNMPTPHIIIHNIMNIATIHHITHLHLRNPKFITTHYYTWNNSKIILLGGDIQPNPGPLSHITKYLPQEYKQRLKQYFLPNTTTLKPRYAHLEQLFTPHLAYGSQNTISQELTQLQKHKPTLSKYPLHLQIYALIVTYSPIPQICNQRLMVDIDPIGLTLLRKLQKLSESTPLHVPPKINLTNNTTLNTIAQAYTHINTKIARGEDITTLTLKKDLPHIPPHILQELTKCTLPVIGYHPHTTLPQNTHTTSNTTTTTNHNTSQLKLITWNAGCINSSLPGILELTQKFHKDPHIILIQETKIHIIFR